MLVKEDTTVTIDTFLREIEIMQVCFFLLGGNRSILIFQNVLFLFYFRFSLFEVIKMNAQ